MIKYLIPSLLLAQMAWAAPYKMLLITDPETRAHADEFAQYIKNKSPFNKMGDQFQIEVSEMSADEMNCSNDKPETPRIISCNHNKLWKQKTDSNAHVALAFTSRGTGGAGGSIPVASKDYPLSTMLHELLHNYGLDDEYNYSESERNVYCKPPHAGANVALIKPEEPYADKADVFSRHGDKISWAGDIEEATLVTKGSALGTAEAPELRDKAGLFEGGNCTGTPGLEKNVYRPYMGSIMRQLNNDNLYPLYERRIIAAVESARGEKLTLAPVATPSTISAPEPRQPTTEVSTQCDPAQFNAVMTGQRSSDALMEDAKHIYEHFKNPTNPHPEKKDGK